MFFRPNFIIIPLLTVLLALLGRLFSVQCDATLWYQSLKLLSITPETTIFPIVWNTIYALTALAALVVWNTFERDIRFWAIMGLFVLNGFLNVFWPYLFFTHHMIGAALLEAIALEFVTVLLLGMIASRSLLVGLLLIPYVAWNVFAIYLNYMIWIMN